MQRYRTFSLVLLGALAVGCGSSSPAADMAAHDMAVKASDMSVPADLVPAADLLPATYKVNAGGATNVFNPSTLSISAGDTVMWTFVNAGHNVVSGTAGTADNKFCSPNNANCGTTSTQAAATTYSFTFMNKGTFPYFCKPHVNAGMTGTITVN